MHCNLSKLLSAITAGAAGGKADRRLALDHHGRRGQGHRQARAGVSAQGLAPHHSQLPHRFEGFLAGNGGRKADKRRMNE